MEKQHLNNFEWSVQLSIGNDSIDTDHKVLFSIYSDLNHILSNKENRAELARTLSKMTDYCLMHFKKEELYMERMKYPRLDEHKIAHREYCYKVSMFNSALLSSQPPQPFQLILFLKNWWTNHIMNIDKQYEVYKHNIHSIVEY